MLKIEMLEHRVRVIVHVLVLKFEKVGKLSVSPIEALAIFTMAGNSWLLLWPVNDAFEHQICIY